LALASGLSVVAAFITPLESHRRLVAGVIGRDHLSLIHLDTPLEICRQRDVKGLYAGAETGKVAHMTGFTSAFELPRQSDLILHPGREPVQASTASLLEFALRKLGVTSAA
jgi:adenylylsulfate kinase-like enzyme